jgi:16S rRNA processing protein RimM
LIPFSEASVLDIDLESGRITIDPLAAGLVDSEDDAPNFTPDQPKKKK